jgi:hypothetical protein
MLKLLKSDIPVIEQSIRSADSEFPPYMSIDSLIPTRIEANSDLENYLSELIHNAHEIVAQYDTAIDRVSVKLVFENAFVDHAVDLRHFREGVYKLYKKRMLTTTAIENEYSDFIYGQLWCASWGFIQNHVHRGAYVYDSLEDGGKPIDDDAQDYLSLLNWNVPSFLDASNVSTLTIEEYFPIDLSCVFFSKVELEHISKFQVPQSSSSNTERLLYVTAYRNFVDANKPVQSLEAKNTIRRSIQRDRELVMIGWMAANQLHAGDIVSTGRNRCWNELEGMCPGQFTSKDGRKLGIDAVKAFFDKAVKNNICKFRE